MKAIQINQYGGNEIINIKDIPISTPQPSQVLVKIKAAAVNPVDWKVRNGLLHQMRPLTFPSGLGMDFSGIIYAIGKDVTAFKKGDEVYGCVNFFNGDTGTFAEYATVDTKVIALKPAALSHTEAASLPMAGVSALQALIDYMQLKSGQKILIHGGGGSIGSFAIQIAKSLGAYIATTVSKNSMDFVRTFGADEIIDYQHQDFEQLPQDYDAVLDTVGGKTYQKSFSVLKQGGTLISMLEKPNQALAKQGRIKALLEFTDTTTDRLNHLTQLVIDKKIKTPIAQVFSLKDTGKALEFQQHGHPQGKIIIENSRS